MSKRLFGFYGKRHPPTDIERLHYTLSACFTRIYLHELITAVDVSWLNIDLGRKAKLAFEIKHRSYIVQRTQ